MSDAVVRHRDRDRLLLLGPGAIAAAAPHLEGADVLLTTPRARAQLPAAAGWARTTVDVPAGRVDEVAAALRERVVGRRLVALGGGRVIDVAKALAAADPPRTVVAVPTTLSAAEMTGSHRQARGVAPGTPTVAASVVVVDPALSASQPPAERAASSANALGHALTALASDRSDPIAGAVARDAVRTIAAAWRAGDPDPLPLATAAVQAGWALDGVGLALHHAIAQEAVRQAGAAHATANAAVLPGTVAAIRRRRPALVGELDGLLGEPLEAVAERLRERAGAAVPALAEPAARERVAAAVLARGPQLERIGPPPDAAELDALLLAAARR
ncbi:iron-containing alcohol dehydrogenase [Patulibacter defluvii]|uniref:iron-containing alcohol dehydrogenase n=1 Tax=Patulibacter defluvii TaxID=3095358 RepID=UPI002A759077|nr:iron-containing alcohol dehydrogenase [Patulibacter sp. DM4]